MADVSAYADLIRTNQPAIAARVIQNLNNTQNPNINQRYWHRQLLTKTYSTDLRWTSLTTVNGSRVAADYVAFDSSIPLKTRDSLATLGGEVPKMGMEMQMREKQLTDLGIIQRTPGQQPQLVAKLFDDTPRLITGVYERNEFTFLQGFSSGIGLSQDDNNVGIGIRINYGYLSANKFGTVGAVWAANPTTATPITDLTRVVRKAQGDGNVITTWYMDRNTFNAMIATTEVRNYVSASLGLSTTFPIPTADQVNTAIQSYFGWNFQIVERSVITEKDGVRTTRNPWAAGQVVGTQGGVVGSLTWSRLAEMDSPVEHVIYNIVDDFILLGRYRKTEPSLSEITKVQALVLPVIDNVSAIYTLDSTTVQP